MESLALFLKALLGEESVIQTALKEAPSIAESLSKTIEKMNGMLGNSEMKGKKEILKYFKWSMGQGKILEKLRLSVENTM